MKIDQRLQDLVIPLLDLRKENKNHEKSSKLQDGTTRLDCYQSYPWHQRYSVIEFFNWTASEKQCFSKLKDGLELEFQLYPSITYIFATNWKHDLQLLSVLI
jgi:hypothetical protein